MRDVEAFVAALPELGVAAQFAPAYRSALATVERGLRRAGRSELTEADLPELLSAMAVEGAGERQLHNLEVVCRGYLAWRSSRGVPGAPVDAPATLPPPVAPTAVPTGPLPAVRPPGSRPSGAYAAVRVGGAAARVGPRIPREALIGLVAGALLLAGLVIFRPAPTARAVAEKPPLPLHEVGPVEGPALGTNCQRLARCCQEQGALSVFCGAAATGSQGECASAIASLREEDVVCDAPPRAGGAGP